MKLKEIKKNIHGKTKQKYAVTLRWHPTKEMK